MRKCDFSNSLEHHAVNEKKSSLLSDIVRTLSDEQHQSEYIGKMGLYPRSCENCRFVYQTSASFSKHRSSGQCSKRIALQNEEKHITINNINQGTINNYANCTVQIDGADVESVQHLLNIDTSFNALQQQQLSRLKRLLDKAEIADKEQLVAFIDYYSTTGSALLLEFETNGEVVKEINEFVFSGYVPVKEKYNKLLERHITYLRDSPREFVLLLAKMLWKQIFLPTLNNDKTLETLAKRTIRMTENGGIVDSTMCRIRESTKVFGDERVPLTKEEYCRKYNHEELLDEDGDLSEADRMDIDFKYLHHARLQHSWSKEEITDGIICNNLKRICEKICRELLDDRVCEFLKTQADLMEFAKDIAHEQKPLFIPEKTRKEVERWIVQDNKDHLVSAWYLINDAVDVSNAKEDVQLDQRKKRKPDWLREHEKREDFRRNVPM